MCNIDQGGVREGEGLATAGQEQKWLAVEDKVGYYWSMKVNRVQVTDKNKKKTTTFVFGETLPEKLPRAAKVYFKTAVTPQRTHDAVARVKEIEAKAKAKHVC